jgi:predicted transcriptional regulator
MDVILSPDLHAKLTRIARERGIDAQALAREAIERLVGYDDWFVREVEKGLAQVERGETLSHEQVGARLEQHLTDKPPRL